MALISAEKPIVGPARNPTDLQLGSFVAQYKATGLPVEVDFRELVPGLANPDRATHLIHPYPAKLLMHIPHFFLSSEILSARGDLVFDPFCGSGTVLLESMLAGRCAIGCDTNPLAVMISRAKTTRLDADALRCECDLVLKRMISRPRPEPPDVVNIRKWFHPRVIRQLCLLLVSIEQVTDPSVKDFFLVCFSNCVRRVSLADPRISVPVRLRSGKYPKRHRLHEKTKQHLAWLQKVEVVDVFSGIVEANIRRMSQLAALPNLGTQAVAECIDARDAVGVSISNGPSPVLPVRQESVQLVITSPPYAGAQKYIRSSSLSLGWLGICRSTDLKKYDNSTIGREQFRKDAYSELAATGHQDADELLAELFTVNPQRAHIAATYLREMRRALRSTAAAVIPGGYAVLVVGNNHICGREFDCSRFLSDIMCELGFVLTLAMVDRIRSRGLMTKRNKTAGLIQSESVLLFRKV